MIAKLRMTLLGVCSLLCMLICSANAEALTASVSDVHVNSQGETVFNIHWDPGCISLGRFFWQGKYFDNITVNPYYMHVLERNRNTGATQQFPVQNRGVATMVRPNANQCEYYVYMEGSSPINGRRCSESSNPVSVYTSFPGCPQFTSSYGVLPVGSHIELRWQNSGNAGIYELQRDTSPTFDSSDLQSYWPQFGIEKFNSMPQGIFYYRVRAWSAVPEAGGTSTSWSDVLTVNVGCAPNAPVISPVGEIFAGSDMRLEWSSVDTAVIYQVYYSRTPDFSDMENEGCWPGSNYEVFTNIEAGKHYYKVRAWNDYPENGGIASGWSDVYSVDVQDNIAAPHLTVPADIAEGQNLIVDWNDVDNAFIYQLMVANDESFSDPQQFWPSSSDETINNIQRDNYFLRVRAWTALPENGGVASEWSNVGQVFVMCIIDTPVLTQPDDAIKGQSFRLEWADVEDAAIYQVERDTVATFDSGASDQFWPSSPYEDMSINQTGDFYYRVRAWTAPPQNDGHSSEWSNVVSNTVELGIEPPVFDPMGNYYEGQTLPVEWNDVEDAFIYQLVCSTSEDFSAGYREFWPQNSNENVTTDSAGTYYFKVRAWSALPEDGGYSSLWSATFFVNVLPVPQPPQIDEVGQVGDGVPFTVDWNDVDGIYIYQLMRDTEPDFSSEECSQFWPQNSQESMSVAHAGEFYFRVRGWTEVPEEGGVSTAWSETFTVNALPRNPVLPDSVNIAYPEDTLIDWTDVVGASIYELQISDTYDFSAGVEQFWPGISNENYVSAAPGQKYVRVRSWQDLPENGGAHGGWSNTMVLSVNPAVPDLFRSGEDAFDDEQIELQWADINPTDTVSYEITYYRVDANEASVTQSYDGHSCAIGPLSGGVYNISIKAVYSSGNVILKSDSSTVYMKVFDDAAFLSHISREMFDCLMETTYANGLTRDRYHADRSGVNYALGDETDAVSTAACGFYLSALTVGVENGWISFQDAQQKALITLTTFSQVSNYHGFFYHFLKPDGTPSDEPYREVSSIDTALFLSGALQAGEYFGGDVKVKAEFLYERVDWTQMFNWYNYLFHMGWDEDEGLFCDYDSYSESMLLYILAMGSPNHPVPAHAFYNWARRKGSYGDGEEMIFTFGGQLFTYQFPHAWIDFRNTTDALGVDWWENSVKAVVADREYCIDNDSKGYSEYIWGLSACDGPERYEAYGAQPACDSTDDGTIAPYTIMASLPFAENVVIDSLKHLYSTEKDVIWGEYGFVDGFNKNQDWGGDYYLGIDQGIALLMIENQRSGIVWEKFMQSPYITTALQRLRFEGYGQPYSALEDFEDGNEWTPETSLGWWDSDGSLVYNRTGENYMSHGGSRAMKVEFNKNGRAWSCFGGCIGSSNPMKDFSNKSKLCFWVCGEVELLVKLRDADQNEYELGTKTSVSSGSWTYFEFDLNTVTGLDMSRIDNILFFAAPGSTDAEGWFVIDDIVVE